MNKYAILLSYPKKNSDKCKNVKFAPDKTKLEEVIKANKGNISHIIPL